MHADDLNVRSDAFLKAIEDTGLVGTWHWSFASGEQRWSPGFVRLLGLAAHSVAPSYALFVDLVCPEDRRRIAGPADVLAGLVLPCALLRVIRPSGELRNLSVRSELRFAPDGRPTGLSGIALDVTDRARLSLMLQREELRRRALYQATYAITYTVEPNNTYDFPPEMATAHGLDLAAIRSDPFLMVVPWDRPAFRDAAMAVRSHVARFQETARERLADGEVRRFRIIGVPLWDPAGRYLGRAGMKYPIHDSGAPLSGTAPPLDGAIRRGLEDGVEAPHLRAARGLLDWSMAQLAAASGVSLSTIKRLEDGSEIRGALSRVKAIAALRGAGIRFMMMDGGQIAVTRA